MCLQGLGSKAAGVDRAAPSDQEMAALDESSDDGEEEEEESSDEGDDPDEDRRSDLKKLDAAVGPSCASLLYVWILWALSGSQIREQYAE